MKRLIFLFALTLGAQGVEVQSLSCHDRKAGLDPPPDFTCTVTFTAKVPAAGKLIVLVGNHTERATKTISVPVKAGATSVTFDTGEEQALRAKLQ